MAGRAQRAMRTGAAAVLLGLAALGGGAVRAEETTAAARDDAGRPLQLARPAQRIAALAPHLVELVYAAGAGERLVAVSRYSDTPAAAARLPVVSDAFAVNLEALAALQPDLVLVWQSGMPERQRQALQALAARQGFAVFESEIRSVEGIADTLQRLGHLAGTRAVADPAAAQLRQDWQALQARYRGAVPVRVFYQVWDPPLMTFNGRHIVGVALRACGGVGGFDALGALTPTVSREAVLAFNPQLILAGADPAAPTSLAAWRLLPQIDAVRHQQLKVVDAAVLTRMGPRFVQAAAGLCATIDQTRQALAGAH